MNDNRQIDLYDAGLFFFLFRQIIIVLKVGLIKLAPLPLLLLNSSNFF